VLGHGYAHDFRIFRDAGTGPCRREPRSRPAPSHRSLIAASPCPSRHVDKPLRKHGSPHNEGGTRGNTLSDH
jgi:hypothetical protein